ncbi:tyrosine-type recombinase/integrase [Pantoea sp. CCBC3-3-1]|uniref:tyrosine-type recombinase/integrase n=1 Tax=Pantoea sp. CCBC3-3-1 TaxID=2490851 RepID=UPI00143DBFE4|nr:tyrosine-type recombinase/integrase [Pantoea sp. CCBC3-3-1]
MTKKQESTALALPDNIDDRVAENLRRLFEDQAAFSHNTWQQMLSVIRAWARWCEANGRSWFPAAPADVREYLFHMKENLGRAVNTVSQHQAMINKIHKHAGLPRPSDDIAVELGMKRIRRTAVLQGERVSQALPLKVDDLFKLANIWEESESLKHRRNLAFIGVSYNSLLRLAEVARLRVRDFRFMPDGSATFDVGYTKTITDQNGVVKKLSADVTSWLRAWLRLSGLESVPEAYVFCKVDRYNHAIRSKGPMDAKHIETLFRDAWISLYGKPDTTATRYRTWTAHSARVGAAQDMAERGKSLPQIMHEGTWKRPEQVINYIRNIEAEKSIMLDIIKGGKKE